MPGVSRAFRPWRCGDLGERAGVSGGPERDLRGMPCYLNSEQGGMCAGLDGMAAGSFGRA
jgi:hypothetical protein